MNDKPYHAQRMEIICESPDVRVAEITLSLLSDRITGTALNFDAPSSNCLPCRG